MIPRGVTSPLGRLARWLRREDGNASVEFVVVFPVLFYFFIATVEVGFVLTKGVLLDRALDLAVRPVRLGTPTDHAGLIDNLCANLPLTNCKESIRLEMRTVDPLSDLPLSDETLCLNFEEPGGIDPDTNFDLGLPDEMVLLRACALVSPLTPLTGVGLLMPKDPSGNYRLVSTNAFVNEPGSG